MTNKRFLWIVHMVYSIVLVVDALSRENIDLVVLIAAVNIAFMGCIIYEQSNTIRNLENK